MANEATVFGRRVFRSFAVAVALLCCRTGAHGLRQSEARRSAGGGAQASLPPLPRGGFSPRFYGPSVSMGALKQSQSNGRMHGAPSTSQLGADDGGFADTENGDGRNGAIAVRGTSRDVSLYYLIWSRGFLPKLVAAGACFAVLHVLAAWMSRSGYFFFVPPNLSTATSVVCGDFVVPLLASSCCAVQLLINVLAGGCAGFGTYLGPVRPFFLAMLGYLTLLSKQRGTLRIGTAVLRAFLAFLPEIVHLANWARQELWVRSPAYQQQEPDGQIRARIEISVPTMGCVSCINKIDESLRGSSPGHVLNAKSWLISASEDGTKKGGVAVVEVVVDSHDELEDIRQHLVRTMGEVGFGKGVQVESTQLESNQP